MSNNEFNNNNITNSNVNNVQNVKNIQYNSIQYNSNSLNTIENCVKSKSKNLGNYYFYLILDIVALIANAVTIISFFKKSNEDSPILKTFDVFQTHKSMVYLMFMFILLICALKILRSIKRRKGYWKFVIKSNKIHYIKTEKCPKCNSNTARKLSVKQVEKNRFQFVCKNNPNHAINIDYGDVIDYIE